MANDTLEAEILAKALWEGLGDQKPWFYHVVPAKTIVLPRKPMVLPRKSNQQILGLLINR